ncbi:MAG: 16S rRNA (uracil(1498)-N(3))-methyltransferase [Inquilinaceae bacterium]
MTGRPRTRLFVPDPLGVDATVELSAGQAHYLRRVLRLTAGDMVALFNGRDGEWLARCAMRGKTVAATPLRRVRPQAAGPDLWLCFAPVKKTATDFIVEKATELGVARLRPVRTQRTETARINLERLTAHVIEAAEQCERLDVPSLSPIVDLAALPSAWPPDRLLLVCAETGTVEPLADVARASAGRPVAFLTGPEGGFAMSELDALGKLPFVRFVGLGPRILRAETAALAVLAGWQTVAGDGRERPADRSGD